MEMAGSVSNRNVESRDSPRLRWREPMLHRNRWGDWTRFRERTGVLGARRIR